jgi:hypothetical protein
VLPPD